MNTININEYFGCNCLDENIACNVTHVDFGITGFVLKPEEISKELGISPDRCWNKDNIVQRKNGTSFKRPYGLLAFNSKHIQSTSTERHILYVVELLEPKKKLLDKYLNDETLRVSLRIWWEAKDGHGGYTVSSKTLLRLAVMCHEVDYTFV